MCFGWLYTTYKRKKNGRRHGEVHESSSSIIEDIDKVVRNRISAIRHMGDGKYDEYFQLWLVTR